MNYYKSKSTSSKNKITTGENRSKSSSVDLEQNSSSDEDTCVVCFRNVNIYSIGECDHPVCYECSTRMRVLCQQNECPICRQLLAKVIFTYDKLPYRELEAKNRSEYYNKKYKIAFYTHAIQQAFFKLLEHPCPKCDTPPYRTFSGLSSHVRREHDFHYCDLCTENLKIFTFERRCYTPAELGIHRSKGDADNRSHRGHPLCEYCNKRYLDRDELFRHLRREHFFCHFCEADGGNEFYKDYDALAEHFRREHFLCERGRCATEQFVGAFRTEIDYKAHVANVHGESLNKQQAKQTRTLQLEITLGPRGRAGQPEANVRSRPIPEEVADEVPEINSMNSARAITIDASNEQDFPSLGGAQGPNISLVRPPPILHRSSVAGLARTKENFPALGGSGGGNANGAANITSRNQNAAPMASMLKKTQITAQKNNVKNNPLAPGPPLPTPSAVKNGSGMVLHVSNRPSTAASNNHNNNNNNNNNASKKQSNFDFPALPNNKAAAIAMKKANARAQLEEDMGSEVAVPLANVSAKHRTLVDDYVSVANPNNFQKFKMVQKEQLEREARRNAESKEAPKLTTNNFPSLAGPSNGSTTGNTSGWVKLTSDKKLRENENRNNKVAPAPQLPNKTFTTNKKDKKQDKKDKQPQQQQQKEYKTNDVIAPPPGFSSSNTVKPPPGFHSNVTVNSVAKPSNDLTFTSSLGESFSILPQHVYLPPPNAESRRENLDKIFHEMLPAARVLREFWNVSRMFREGSYKATAYYDYCRAVLHNKFDKVFPELIAMLPDIPKQQSIYLEHKQRLNNLPASERKSLPRLEVCSKCKQVLISADMDNHKKSHERSNGLPLNSNS